MWEAIKPVNTNEQLRFLKSLEDKQRRHEMQLKSSLNIERIQSHIRRHLSNRRAVRPFVQEATEKVGAILAVRTSYEETKFRTMLKNALNKMPFFWQTLAFINDYNSITFKLFLETMGDLVSQDEALVRHTLENSGARAILLTRLMRLLASFTSQNPKIIKFLQNFTNEVSRLNNREEILSGMISRKNFEVLFGLSSKRVLNEEMGQVIARRVITKELTTRTLNSFTYTTLFLLNPTITLQSLPQFTHILEDINFNDSSAITQLMQLPTPQLQSLFSNSLLTLKALNPQEHCDDRHTSIVLLVHRVVMHAYTEKEIEEIKHQLYKRNTVIETDDNSEEIKERVKLTTRYTQLSRALSQEVYFTFLFSQLGKILHSSHPTEETKALLSRNTLNDICFIYIKLFEVLEIQRLSILCSRQFILTLAEYLRQSKVKFTFIDEQSPSSRLIYIYLMAMGKLFGHMDDFEFTTPSMSFPKEVILDMLTSSYKLLISVVNKKLQSKLLKDIANEAMECLTHLHTKNSRTNYFDNRVFCGSSESTETSFSLLSVSGIEKYINKVPFVVPFNIRYERFKLSLGNYLSYDHYNQTYIQIKRGRELEDAYEQLKAFDMSRPFHITFTSQNGVKEVGVDAGGLLKEFIIRVMKDAFSPKRGLFIETITREMIPNPDFKGEGHYYVFVGKLVAKAILNSTLVPVKLSSCLINLMLGRRNTIEDLRFIDKTFYTNLMKLKHSSEDIAPLQFTFSHLENNQLVLLKENGNNIPVTNETKMEFIRLLADYKTNKLFLNQSQKFRKGFSRMIPSVEFEKFNYEELNMIISGRSVKLDVEDLKRNTIYEGYSLEDDTIQSFWETVTEFNKEERIDLLKFVTSCDTPPIMGFAQLSPKFKISILRDPNSEEYLPRASTCVNTLYLPDYQNKQILSKKLGYAIKENEGFGLA